MQQISEEINGYTPADITQLYREIVLKKLVQQQMDANSSVMHLSYIDFKEMMYSTQSSFKRTAMFVDGHDNNNHKNNQPHVFGS